MKKLVAALMIAGAVVAGGAANAQAVSYNNNNSRTPTLSATTVSPGSSFTVTVGCIIGESITFVFEGTSITAVCALNAPVQAESLNGTASANFTAPTTAGSYIGSVTFPTAPQANFTVTVQAVPATTAPVGGLPATGSDSTGSTMTIAALLLVAGAGMFGVAHMRRRGVATA